MSAERSYTVAELFHGGGVQRNVRGAADMRVRDRGTAQGCPKVRSDIRYYLCSVFCLITLGSVPVHLNVL